jgi:nucleoside-diphosphate-sugar epimerase
MNSSRKIFCFGYGYTCDYLGHFLKLQGGWDIAGTTRDPERRDLLRGRGIEMHSFDEGDPLPDAKLLLKDVTHILISTPPGDDGDPTFLAHAEDIAALPSLQWLGYFSTTGVYGNRDGRFVDENSEVRPSSRRGKRRAKAEEQWLSLYESAGVPVHIFRLAGIYGPGRSALDSIRAGMARRIYKHGHAFGRIHVEDIVNVIDKSIQKPQPGQVYNVCDNLPAPSHEVIEYACELLNREPPPMVDFEDANLAPITRSFYLDNRRTRNDKLGRELGVQLKYPDFRAGLRGCFEAEQHALGAAAAGASDGEKTSKIPSIFKK